MSRFDLPEARDAASLQHAPEGLSQHVRENASHYLKSPSAQLDSNVLARLSLTEKGEQRLIQSAPDEFLVPGEHMRGRASSPEDQALGKEIAAALQKNIYGLYELAREIVALECAIFKELASLLAKKSGPALDCSAPIGDYQRPPQAIMPPQVPASATRAAEAPLPARIPKTEVRMDDTEPTPQRSQERISQLVPLEHLEPPPPGVSSGNGPFKVALLSGMAQIPMTGSMPDNQQSTVYAGRNDTQSMQIGIEAPTTGLTNVNVSVSDLVGKNGEKIASDNVTLYREHFVQVTKTTAAPQGDPHAPNLPGKPGWYADGLIPFIDPDTGKPPVNPKPGMVANGFNLEAGKNQPIWADLNVPPGTPPGDYKAMITVNSDQGKQQVPLSLHVWNFDLPTKPTLHTAFNATGDNSPAVQTELLRNKISPFKIDPANRQKYEQMGLNATNLGFYSGADYEHPQMSAPPSVASIQAAKGASDPKLLTYDYSADEIGGHPNLDPVMKQWARNLHAAGVDNLVTMAPTPGLADDESGSGRSAVDIWTMLPVQYDKAKGIIPGFQKKGDKMWSYNTLVQDSYSPKWLIDYSLLNERLQPGFISHSLGLTGMLDWSVTNWSNDPWNNPYHNFNLPGEGALVLPGQAAGLKGNAPTMRLKALRDGIQDYEYMQILKNSGGEEVAQQISRIIGPDWKNWTRDPQAVEKAHVQLGEEIERLQNHAH